MKKRYYIVCPCCNHAVELIKGESGPELATNPEPISDDEEMVFAEDRPDQPDRPEPKPTTKRKPKTDKETDMSKGTPIRIDAIKGKALKVGSTECVKRNHKLIAEVLKETPGMTYDDLISELEFSHDKTEKVMRGYVTDGLRKGMYEVDGLEVAQPEEEEEEEW